MLWNRSYFWVSTLKMRGRWEGSDITEPSWTGGANEVAQQSEKEWRALVVALGLGSAHRSGLAYKDSWCEDLWHRGHTSRWDWDSKTWSQLVSFPRASWLLGNLQPLGKHHRRCSGSHLQSAGWCASPVDKSERSAYRCAEKNPENIGVHVKTSVV